MLDRIPMLSTYDMYEVEADRETGHWLHEPIFVDTVNRSAWHKMRDTDAAHFDTYEHGSTTRAITVRWV